MTYVNSCFFTPLLLPCFLKYFLETRGAWSNAFHKREETFEYAPLADGERNESSGAENGHDIYVFDGDNFKDTRSTENLDKIATESKITVRETAWLSFEFSFLWVSSGLILLKNERS